MAASDLPTTIETVTGRFVDLANPDPRDIAIQDIAWALSRMPRFSGHTITKIPYSVAQHSISVAREVPLICRDNEPDAATSYLKRISMLGLLHDASEAYTSDISGPLKKIPELRPIIKAIEHKIQDAIYQALGIEEPTGTEETWIKTGDILAQRIEAYNFMVSRGKTWSLQIEDSFIKLQEFEAPKEPIVIYKEFLSMFDELNS